MSFDLEKLSTIIGTKLTDATLFETAVTHRSYLNEHPNYRNPSNERLEFLGDAVLQLLSSQYLYEKYNEPEGVLTNYRASIVNTSSLAAEARRLGYGGLLYLSKGEEANGGRHREYILANTFEAILGALYVEKGLEFCREFIKRELLYKVDTIVKAKSYKDSKSLFQEKAQELLGVTPEYRVIEAWGPDHEKTFRIGVYINDKEFGVGEGSSKQRGEQAAAEEALKTLGG